MIIRIAPFVVVLFLLTLAACGGSSDEPPGRFDPGAEPAETPETFDPFAE